jgi:hypothetical protein
MVVASVAFQSSLCGMLRRLWLTLPFPREVRPVVSGGLDGRMTARIVSMDGAGLLPFVL